MMSNNSFLIYNGTADYNVGQKVFIYNHIKDDKNVAYRNGLFIGKSFGYSWKV